MLVRFILRQDVPDRDQQFPRDGDNRSLVSWPPLHTRQHDLPMWVLQRCDMGRFNQRMAQLLSASKLKSA